MKTLNMSNNKSDMKQLFADMLPVIITALAIIMMEMLYKIFGG